MNKLVSSRLGYLLSTQDPLNVGPLHRTAWWVLHGTLPHFPSTIFGGYLRDVLSDAGEPNDIDVRIPYDVSVAAFSEAVYQWGSGIDTNCAVVPRRRAGDRAATRVDLMLYGSVISLDVVNSGMCSLFPNVDVNNLGIDSSGYLREMMVSPQGLDGIAENLRRRRYILYNSSTNINGLRRMRERGWREWNERI